MKLAVVGSRSWEDKKRIEKEISKYSGIEEIISGGAQGADSFAAEIAAEKGIFLNVIRPDISRDRGKILPERYLERNARIVLEADKVLIFWDGVSRGSRMVLEFCKLIRKPYELITNGTSGNSRNSERKKR
jgi:hypothetical protein